MYVQLYYEALGYDYASGYGKTTEYYCLIQILWPRQLVLDSTSVATLFLLLGAFPLVEIESFTVIER